MPSDHSKSLLLELLKELSNAYIQAYLHTLTDIYTQTYTYTLQLHFNIFEGVLKYTFILFSVCVLMYATHMQVPVEVRRAH